MGLPTNARGWHTLHVFHDSLLRLVFHTIVLTTVGFHTNVLTSHFLWTLAASRNVLQADVENKPFDRKRLVTAVSPYVFSQLSHRPDHVYVTHVVIL